MQKKIIKKASKVFSIIVLILIGLFFRLWKLRSFQYWSDDEQLLWSIIRHIIIDKHPSLVTANVALGVALGPLFHYLLVPWFWLVKLNPEKILLLGNLFGLLSIIAIYKAGKLIGGKRVAFISGFLYAVSFISSLFDRRLWALSPDVLLTTLGVISLIKIIKGDSRYLLLLTLPAVFSINSDPSLGVIVLASLLTLLIFKPKIDKKYILYSLILFFILSSPLIIFEFRHYGQNIRSVSETLSQININNKPAGSNDKNILISQIENFSRFFYARSTNNADAYFCYCKLDDKIPPIITITTFLMLTLFTYISFRKHNKSYFVLLITLVSYLFGILIFKKVLSGDSAFFYSVAVSPIIFLIAAILISKSKILTVFLLPIIFLVNFHSLSHSGFKYPLQDKVKIVTETISKIKGSKDFSLYYSGDILLSGGGWTSLFMAQGYTPSKGSLSLYWGHVYSSYQLYPVQFSKDEPETIVVISEKQPEKANSKNIIDSVNVGNIFSTIYNNKGRWFYPAGSVEKLYQPSYFK